MVVVISTAVSFLQYQVFVSVVNKATHNTDGSAAQCQLAIKMKALCTGLEDLLSIHPLHPPHILLDQDLHAFSIPVETIMEPGCLLIRAGCSCRSSGNVCAVTSKQTPHSMQTGHGIS
ncbi:hypothetical protein EXN66_Car004277 [Channa argus]|uniref:Uncharacterized protein n=1 Tax=Channa argus TaxID=215402 RepID=A0A6G1PEB6_CHAAH|nr:hypothetical protein EXN66_Car004277 [Channa argus]